MKTHKHFSQPEENFFSLQAGAIEEKTTSSESWKPVKAGPMEELFPLKESFWLQMEEGIRRRISTPESVWSLSLITWKPALASLILLLGIGIGFRFYTHQLTDQETTALHLEQLKQEEILLYLTEQPDNLDLSQQVAVQHLPDNALDLPLDCPADELLEDINLNETDFESSL